MLCEIHGLLYIWILSYFISQALYIAFKCQTWLSNIPFTAKLMKQCQDDLRLYPFKFSMTVCIEGLLDVKTLIYRYMC